MLILQRKTGESLILGGNIKITVVETGNDGVKLAIDAPRDVVILREELAKAMQANKDAARGTEKIKKIKEILRENKQIS